MKSNTIVLAALALGACTGTGTTPMTVVDPVSVEALAQATSMAADYRIGPSDLLNIQVFQVEDLSFDEVRVDASGLLEFPLIGSLQASGKTPAELSREIELRLGDRYLRDPRVMVAVTEASSQKITVDGAVNKPGVYKMQGRTTLLQAIAMAEGASRVADSRQVAVFRTVEGRRMAAIFDLRMIQAGSMEDPILMGDDVVVMDTSRLSVAMREILGALPSLAIFAYY